MQMDRVRLQLLAMLVENLSDAIADVDTARGDYIKVADDGTLTTEPLTTPAPVLYLPHPALETTIVTWPTLVILPRRAPLVSPDTEGYIERRYELDIELWYADSDHQNLAIALERSTSALTQVVVDTAKWHPLLVLSPTVDDALFSDVAQDDGEFLRASRISLSVSVIEGDAETP